MGLTVLNLVGLLVSFQPIALVVPAAEFLVQTPPKTTQAIEGLRHWLNIPTDQRPSLRDQEFAKTALTRQDAKAAQQLLWHDHVEQLKRERANEFESKVVRVGDVEMKYDVVRFVDADDSDKPLSLFISMHGGGQAPPQVNESQWKNQIRLGQGYNPKHAIYVAPRAPTNDWNLWHQSHIDDLFDRLISTMIAFEGIDRNHVYLMGYSAGGDGVYQLAPRMADRFAAASMMAGHPNDASPLGLRNLPFTIHVGGKDNGFRRNEVAAEWKEKLEQLRADDQSGYVHLVDIHADKGHWMDMEDKIAIKWMQQYQRTPLPRKVVWKQSSTKHDRFYWIAADPDISTAGDEVVAEFDGQQVVVERKSGKPALDVMLNDQMLDLDQPVVVTIDGSRIFEGTVPRTIASIALTMDQRSDSGLVFSSIVSAPSKVLP